MAQRKRLTIGWCVAVLIWATLSPFLRAGGPKLDLPPLREIRTQHYVIRTDLDESLVNELAPRMDGMFAEYARRLADFHDNREFPMLDVYLFSKRADYARLTEDRFRNTGGIFIAGPMNLLAAFLQDQGRDSLRRTLQHEAFHQFAYNAISPDLPIWLNEGMAQVFEEGLWVGDTFMLGQVPPRRLRQLKADIDHDRLMDFKQFLAVTPEQWSKNLSADASRGAAEYGQAWAMVQFLIEGEHGAFRPRLIEMLKMIHHGKDADTAFRDAFSSNYDGFRRHFNDWAATLTPTPEAVMIDRQNVLADLVISLSDRGKQFDTIGAFHHAVVSGGYQLQYSKGDMHWKTDSRIDTYFSNASGQLLGPRELYFVTQPQSQLADIVCRCTDQVQLRTKFYQLSGKWWHESTIEKSR
jgi:hypothetical protein